MIKIEFPKDRVLISKQGNTNEIWDVIRKKWLMLTPEEWVRQNVLQYLLLTKKYPASLIAVEKEIRLAALKKRCDIVVYNRQSQPWMIVECKEMNTTLSGKTMEQVLRYHITLSAKYLVVTNGKYCYGFAKKGTQFIEIHLFPDYEPSDNDV